MPFGCAGLRSSAENHAVREAMSVVNICLSFGGFTVKIDVGRAMHWRNASVSTLGKCTSTMPEHATSVAHAKPATAKLPKAVICSPDAPPDSLRLYSERLAHF